MRHSWIAPRVRLACVRHAASVRSEPGSNSQVRLAPSNRKRQVPARPPRIRSELTSFTSCADKQYRSAPPPAHPFLSQPVKQLPPKGLPPQESGAYRLSSHPKSTGFGAEFRALAGLVETPMPHTAALRDSIMHQASLDAARGGRRPHIGNSPAGVQKDRARRPTMSRSTFRHPRNKTTG